MLSDDEDYGARKENDDRTLYLRRTGFGHAGRSILASDAPKRRNEPTSPMGSKMLAPRFGVSGDSSRKSPPPHTHLEDPPRTYDMDAMDEQNMSGEFSPPRDHSRRSSPSRHGSESRTAQQQQSNEGKSQEDPSGRGEPKSSQSKILPPPKMPPPKGARSASAARMQFAKAPPKGGKPGGTRSAAAQYRAKLMKKRQDRDGGGGGKTSDDRDDRDAGGKRADFVPSVAPPPRRSEKILPPSSKIHEPDDDNIKTLRSSNEGTNFHQGLRRVVNRGDETPPTQRKARQKSSKKAKPHVFGMASSDEEDEVVGRDWTKERAEKAVMSVFSHEWEVQSPEAKEVNADEERRRAAAAAGNRPKINRPVGRFSQAMAAQATWEVDASETNHTGGPTFAVVDDDDDHNKRNYDRDDLGDEGDEYDEYEERDRDRYDDYDERRDRGRGDRGDRNRDRDGGRGGRGRSDDDEYEVATDSEEELEPPKRESPKKVQRGEGKSSREDETTEGRKMQDPIVVDTPPRGESKAGAPEAAVAESKTSETKENPTFTHNNEAAAAATAPSPKMSDNESSSIKVYDCTQIPFDKDSLREWLVNPPLGGEEQMVRCFIERDNTFSKDLWWSNKFYPLFRFYAEIDGGPPRLLMYARKLKGKMSANYLISTDKVDMGKSKHKRGDGYIGKLQSSGSNEFTVFDDGVNPSLDGMGQPVDIRREMCVIAYASKKTSSSNGKAPSDRRMEVAIPAIIARPDGQEHSVTWRPRTKEDGMRTWFRRIRLKGSQNVISRERMLCLHNRMWSHGRTCQLEEFMGRAQETSSKNFQLVVSPPEDPFLRNKYDASPLGTIDTDDVANVLVQMGRCSDRFNVDFQYPVSAFAAFGVCLTRFASTSGVKS